MDKIYILLPVHNRREITRRFIACLKRQSYDNYHLVLIDDGSKDGTSDMVRNQIGTCTVLKGQGAWWWAGSLQQGYNWLRDQEAKVSDIVLIANDDTEFDDDFMETAVRHLMGKDGVLLLAKCYDRKTNTLIDRGLHVTWPKLRFERAASNEQINCFSTRGLFLRIGDLYRIGGFFPRLLPHYWSDYEFSIRGFRRGMKPLTDDRLRLWVDRAETGYREISYASLPDFTRTFYSIRSVFNPFRATIFIALACPWKWKPVNWIIIWARAIKSTSKALLLFMIRNIAGYKA